MKSSLILIPFNSLVDDVCDYSDQTMRILAKNKHQVLGIALGNPLSIYSNLSKIIKGGFLIKKSTNIHIFLPVMFFPFQRFEIIKKINFILNIFIINLVFNQSSKQKLMWFFEPKYSKIFLRFLKRDISVYDCVDYFSADKELRVENEFAIKNSDEVFVNSSTLKKLYSSLRKNIKKVPLGFNLPKSLLKKKSIDNKTKTFCFIGSIGDRIDFNFIKKFIKLRKKDKVVFIGPLDLEKKNEKIFLKLVKEKKIYWLGKIPKGEVLREISFFDFGFIPYKQNSFSVNSFPMKVMEYFYLGLPVVSTKINELKLFPEHIYFPEADGWRGMNSFLTKSEGKYLEKRKIATMNSWEKKVGSILNYLK